MLLQLEAEINAQGVDFGHVLQAASVNSHEEVVELPAEAVPEVNGLKSESCGVCSSARSLHLSRTVHWLLS